MLRTVIILSVLTLWLTPYVVAVLAYNPPGWLAALGGAVFGRCIVSTLLLIRFWLHGY